MKLLLQLILTAGVVGYDAGGSRAESPIFTFENAVGIATVYDIDGAEGSLRGGLWDLGIGYYWRDLGVDGGFELGARIAKVGPEGDATGLAFLPTAKYAAGDAANKFIVALSLGYQATGFDRFVAHLLRIDLEVGGRFRLAPAVSLRLSLNSWFGTGSVSYASGDDYFEAGALVEAIGLPKIMVGIDIAL